MAELLLIRACPYCAPAPECFTNQEHDPAFDCPTCVRWIKDLADPHPRCLVALDEEQPPAQEEAKPMTVPAADYPLPADQIRAPEPAPPPVAYPTPKTEQFTVSVKRSMWTEAPKGSYEIGLSVTCTPDAAHPTSAQLDLVHQALSDRLDAYLGTPTH